MDAERKGAKLGRFFFRVSSRHRKTALRNLAMAFPDMPEAERRALAIRVFEHFGMVTLDFVRSDARSDEEVTATTTLSTANTYQEAVDQGKGVLGIGMHFGNWERGAQFLKANGLHSFAVAREADHEGLEAQIRELREATGLHVLPRGNAIRAMLSALRSKKLVVMLVDQNAEEAFVPFFGMPAGTTLGAAVLHLRTGAPIVISSCARVGPNRYEIQMDPPLEFSGADPKPSPTEIMAMIHKRLEELIREHPEQWLWFHDRWKSAREKGLL